MLQIVFLLSIVVQTTTSQTFATSYEVADEESCDISEDGQCSLSLRQLRAKKVESLNTESIKDEKTAESWRWGFAHGGQFTGGSCLWGSCASSRGPTTCHHMRCICQDGYVAAGGTCVSESDGPTMNDDTNTGVSCKYYGYCDGAVGFAACVDGTCWCAAGYIAQQGQCIEGVPTPGPSPAPLPAPTQAPSSSGVAPMSSPAATVVSPVGGLDPEPEATYNDDDCEDAKPGSDCFAKATWAKSDGVYAHPEWYAGVSPADPVTKFQDALYRAGQGGCKRPCTDGLPIDKSKPYAMLTRTTRGIPPPKSPFEYNGIAWPKMTVRGTSTHIFAVGDWGGMAGELPHGHKIIQYPGGHTPGPHVMGRFRSDPLTHVPTCTTLEMADCFGTMGSPCPNATGGACCKSNCGWLKDVDTQAQNLVAEQMKKRAQLHAPDYILNVGDNFYWGGLEGKCGDTPMSKVSDITSTQFSWIWSNIYNGPLANKPWLSVLGNHDWGGREFDAAWDQQIAYTWTSNAWVMPAPYWMQTVEYVDQNFTVDIFMIDSNIEDALANTSANPEHNICGSLHNPPGASCSKANGPPSVAECHDWFQKLWDEGADWVTKKLQASMADWQILVTHFPCGHFASFYRDLHLKYGLDLMVTGHVHFQKMYWAPEKLGGMTCFITGGGGGITSEHNVDPTDPNDHQYGFYDLTISKESIGIESINWKGDVIATATVKQYVGSDTVKAASMPCKPPAVGSKCDIAVNWAKSDGVYAHPDWYGGLTGASSYSEFQSYFYKAHQNECEKAC